MNGRRYRRLASATLLVLTAGVLAGCGLEKAQEPFQDAPRGTSNQEPADTVTFPDGFSNVATKCDHGNRLYVAFKGDAAYGSVTVVADDPTCD